MFRMFSLRSPFMALWLLAAVAFLTFANGLNNAFLIDDHGFFDVKTENPKYLWLHFLPDKNQALKIEAQAEDSFYRPLSSVVPMLSHLAFKGRVMAGYHGVNVLWFALAAWLVYLLLLRLGMAAPAAFAATALYLVHPLNGVVVNYITAGVFAVQVIFMTLCLHSLMGRDAALRSRRRARAWGFLVLSVACFLFALLCHESALFLPVYAAILFTVFDDAPSVLSRIKNGMRKTWPLWLLFALFFVWRLSHASLAEGVFAKVHRFDMSFTQYLATWTLLAAWYLARLVVPGGIVLIMAHQPLKDPAAVTLWLGMFVVLAFAAVAGAWLARRDRFKLLGVAWLVAGFVPVTLACLFQPTNGLIMEPHWFLFPVTGFFILLARTIEQYWSSRDRLRAVLVRAGLAVIVGMWLVMAWQHNAFWGHEVRYCERWLKLAPDFGAANGHLAKAYELSGDFEKARLYYQKMFKPGYETSMAYSNLGLMDLREGRWESARRNFEQAVKVAPYSSVSVLNLGVVEYHDGNIRKALAYFERSRQLDQFAVLPRLNMAKAYERLDDPLQAARELEDVLTIAPANEVALVNLIQIYLRQRDQANTLKVARWILERSRNPQALQNVAILFRSAGEEAPALEAERKSRTLLPSR